MEQRLWSSTHTFLALILSLPIAIACSSTTEDSERGGGTPSGSPLAQQMAAIGQLGDNFVGQNQEAYEGLAHAAEYVATAFETPGATAALRAKAQDGCLPSEYLGTTWEFDSVSSRYMATNFPGGPSNGVRFLIYETSGGSVDVSCTGSLLSTVAVTVSVNVDGTEVLNLQASDAYFGFGTFGASLRGVLRNSDATEEIPFGVLGTGWINVDEQYGDNLSLDFDLGSETYATIMHNLYEDPSFGVSQEAHINVYRQQNFIQLFNYYADLMSMEGIDMSGGGIFYAEEPVGDGYNHFVNCFNGTMDDMMVSAADPSCASSYFEIDPTPLPAGDINAIQNATNALLGMFNAVGGVARVGARVGIAIAASQEQQF